MFYFVLGAVAVAAVGLCLRLLRLLRRQPGAGVAFYDEREENLTRRLAGVLRCSLAEALPSIREEIRIAPTQSDETILKRAAYHYRQALPEKTCSIYRDAAKG